MSHRLENLANPFNGVPITPSIILEEFHIAPKRKHVAKPWMLDGNHSQYHYRIQKKWDKRFGFRKEFLVINVGGELFAHPETIKRIRQQLENIHENPCKPRQ